MSDFDNLYYSLDSDKNSRDDGEKKSSRRKKSPERRGGDKDERPRRKQHLVAWLWGGFLGLGLVIAVVLLLIYNGVIGYMPPIEELEDPHDKMASTLYASDGTTELGRYFQGRGNRIYTDYDKVSPYVIDALIATEDARFEDHSGIDMKAIGRSAVKTVMLRDRSAGGGSTITQQLAKQLFSEPSTRGLKRALQKPIEWMIALKLERFYTKDEIINMYLNRFDFLNNAVGIKTASEVYFGKEPDKLLPQEAATLIGMLKNPSYYNPLRFPDRTRNRRNVVLDQMVKTNKLSAAEAETLKATPLGVEYHRVDHHEDGMPYLREEIRRMMTAEKPKRPKRSDYSTETAWRYAYGKYNTDSTYWEDNPLYGWIAKNPKSDGSYYDLYNDGLRIYTTIDMTMQKYAEESMLDHLAGTLQPAFNNEKRGSKYGPYAVRPGELKGEQAENLILKAIRQTPRYKMMKEGGKSEEEIMKVFNTKTVMDVFTYARKGDHYGTTTKTVTMTPRDSLLYMKTFLRSGMVSMDPVSGYVKAYVGGPDFTFFQYDMAGLGRRQIGSTAKPLLYALALEQDMTPCSTVRYHNLGNWHVKGGGGAGMTLMAALTKSSNGAAACMVMEVGPKNLANKMRMFGLTGYIEPTGPLALGAVEISVKEMVAAYSAFANKGLRTEPIFVTRIEDNKGNLLYSAIPHRTEVLTEDAHLMILSMLENVVNHGTGRPLRGSFNIGADLGGKTGTTNNNVDAWWIGFTPNLVTGVWVGGEEKFIHFYNGGIGQGARSALPIFGKYMKKLYADPKLPYSQDLKFEYPEGWSPCSKESSSSSSHGGGGYIAPVETVIEMDEVEGIYD